MFDRELITPLIYAGFVNLFWEIVCLNSVPLEIHLALHFGKTTHISENWYLVKYFAEALNEDENKTGEPGMVVFC